MKKRLCRHLETYHKGQKEVQNILDLPKGSKERRYTVALLRNTTNFDHYIRGIIRPRRATTNMNDAFFYPCIHCKGVFKKKYLRRHTKLCSANKSKNIKTNSHKKDVSNSQTFVACSMDPTNMISRLNVKEQVLILLINREKCQLKSIYVGNFFKLYSAKEFNSKIKLTFLILTKIVLWFLINSSISIINLKCCVTKNISITIGLYFNL